MKKIYFVRHGESEGNVGLYRQTKETSLNEKGRQQAEAIAARVKKLPVELIVSSTFTRAKETAEIILQHSDKPIEYSGIFTERRRPSVQLGSLKNDPVALEAEKAIEDNFHVPGWRHSDEENFEDIKERAVEALKFLESKTEETILVVTHGYFMRALLGLIIYGEEFNGSDLVQVIKKFRMGNTGISIFLFDPEQENSWEVQTWNDRAHL